MPNPLLKLGNGANRGHKPPDRPEPIEPLIHDEAGNNHPYRGIEDHGVPDTVKPETFEGYDGTRDAYFELENPPADVVPVRIVEGDNSRSRTVLRTHVMQLTVGDGPRLLVGRNDRRSKLTIKSTSAGTGDILWIGGTQEQADSRQGYPLILTNVFPEFPTATQDALFGFVAPGAGGSAAGTVITVWIAEEVSVDI